MDLSGFGRSMAPEVPLSLDFFADAAIAYVESLKWQAEIDLIGHSYGGEVALVMSARHPEKIRKVAVCGTNHGLSLQFW